MIATMQTLRIEFLTMHSTAAGIVDQLSEQGNDPAAMGKAFDAAKNDDSFYLPPEVFENSDFKRIMKVFLSPDGKAARMLITQRGVPASREGISRVEPIRAAAEEALKGTPLEAAEIYLTGAAATVKDVVEGSICDLLIAGILLLVSRIKEEIPAGINTGIIRAMGGTGKVVTNAGLVFAFTMASMVFSELRTIGQVGTTIGLGLLFDTLVVRAFMTPSVAALLGRWFWWPLRVRSRPAGPLRGPTGPRATTGPRTTVASLRSA